MDIELQIDQYLSEFPGDDAIEKFWEPVKNKLLLVPFTKKRLKELRKYWRQYKKDGNWKNLIKSLSNFLIEKGIHKKTVIEPFDKSKLKLIAVDFVS